MCNRQTTRSLCAISKVTDGIGYFNPYWYEALCPAVQWEELLAAAAFPIQSDVCPSPERSAPPFCTLTLPTESWLLPLTKAACQICLSDASCYFLSNCHTNKQKHTAQHWSQQPVNCGQHFGQCRLPQGITVSRRVRFFYSHFLFFKWVPLTLNSFFSLVVIVSSWKFGSFFSTSFRCWTIDIKGKVNVTMRGDDKKLYLHSSTTKVFLYGLS